MIPVLDDLRRQVRTLRTEADLTQADAAEMAEVSQSFVAKLEAGESVPNYADAAALYNALAQAARDETVTAEAMMSTSMVAVAPTATVEEAADTMKAEGFSQLPVLEEGECVGSVTSRDLLGADAEAPVRAHMSAAFPTVPPTTGKDAVAELLAASNAVLVRNQNGITGIITAADLI